jgi:CheY-like chemotaxis protein
MNMAKKRILIVEDEGLLALQLKKQLVQGGYEICGSVGEAEEAVQAALASSPDLVLMDIRLSHNSDGMAAARRIREASAVPIVFVTGYAEDSYREAAARLAPSAYLVKPVLDERILSTIRGFLGE